MYQVDHCLGTGGAMNQKSPVGLQRQHCLGEVLEGRAGAEGVGYLVESSSETSHSAEVPGKAGFDG